MSAGIVPHGQSQEHRWIEGGRTVPDTGDAAAAASSWFFLHQLVHRVAPATFRSLERKEICFANRRNYLHGRGEMDLIEVLAFLGRQTTVKPKIVYMLLDLSLKK